MNTEVISRIVTGVLVGIVVLAGVLPVAASAEGAVPLVSMPGVALHERDDLLLEHALQRLDLLLQIQSDRLSLANLTVSQTREWIATLQTAGKDTADLEAAVVAFAGSLASAQAAHSDAQALANTTAGFDAQGQVVDEGQARQTLKGIRDGMRSCADTINPAARTFHEALRAYRASLRPQNGVDELIPNITISQ